jgi:hypothetical protein
MLSKSRNRPASSSRDTGIVALRRHFIKMKLKRQEKEQNIDFI